MSLIQTPWTSQPQQAVGIDWGNPITSGLVVAFNGSVFFDSASNRLATNNGTTKSGGSVVTNGSSTYAQEDFLARAYVDDVTILAIAKPTALPTTRAAVGSFETTNKTRGSRSLCVTSGGQWAITQMTSNGLCVDSFGSASVGRKDVVIATRDTKTTGGGGVYKWNLNGVSGSGSTSCNGIAVYGNGAPSNRFLVGKGDVGDVGGATAYLSAEVDALVFWNRVLSDAEIRSLSQNPWQIFRPLPRRIFVPVAAGGNVTITGNIGDATAAGLTATVSQAASIAAGVGNSVAAGSQASIAQQYTLSAGIGNASAAGLTATITASGLTTISCTTGNAAAAGSQAIVNSAATVTCSAGNAAAAGLTAALDIAFTILANIGNATGAGLSATIQAATGISCGVANAIASGLTASITNNAPLTDSEKLDLILDILSNRQTLNPATGVYTLYADDGVTVLKTAQAWEDAAGTIPYRGRALQRLDSMG